MKTYFLILFIFSAIVVENFGQTYFTKEAEISFSSYTPLEEIEATNTKAVCILNLDESSVQLSVLMKGFHFKNALMQTHFNENYIESDIYPKAVFKSTTVDFSNFMADKDGDYTVPVSGVLTIKDKDKEITTDAVLTVIGGKITGMTTFVVSPDDFGIEIPSLVKGKIAKEIQVKVNANYELYEKS